MKRPPESFSTPGRAICTAGIVENKRVLKKAPLVGARPNEWSPVVGNDWMRGSPHAGFVAPVALSPRGKGAVEVRHIRILALCLAAVFAMSATTLVVASPALAGGCNQECKEQKEKEKQEAKEKKQQEKREAKEQAEREKNELKAQKKGEKEREEAEDGKGIWAKLFGDCPVDNVNLSGCIHGEAGPESFFQAGKVVVHFEKPVLLNGGFIENELGEFEWQPAESGQTISKEAEPAPPLGEDIDAELLPPAEKERYENYLAAGGSTKVTATIELVRNQPGGIYLNEGNLLVEAGEAFGFPVMIHLNNPFVGKSCYDGSTANPINVPFTTGLTSPEPPNEPIKGFKGHITSTGEGTILIISESLLVNNEYAAPGVHGCGLGGKADAAIDAAEELPSPAGHNTTELNGHLYQAGVEPVREHDGYYSY